MRGARGAQLTGRVHSASQKRGGHYKSTAAQLCGTIYCYHTPSKRRDTEFCTGKKRRIDISGTLARHTGRKEKDIQAHWPRRRKKRYSGSLATGDTGPIHKCGRVGYLRNPPSLCLCIRRQQLAYIWTNLQPTTPSMHLLCYTAKSHDIFCLHCEICTRIG